MTLRSQLVSIVGDANVLDDPSLTERYRIDWTGRYGRHDALVVRPADRLETASVVRRCAEHGVAVVPQGGNTGLAGGSVPGADGAVVLNLERLRQITEVDTVLGQVTVGAGVTPAMLADHLRGSGWRFAVDLGARDSATIGGMVATNAGGMRVFRFGAMRAQLLGLSYVTADGSSASRLRGLQKDNTGYDLTSLLCGSEGTLAVVTAARLRLVPDPPAVTTALLGFADAASARRAAWALRRAVGAVEVLEYVSGACVDAVAEANGGRPPFAAADYVLVEAAADTDPTDALAAAIEALIDTPVDVAVASDAARRAALWRHRDEITTALATLSGDRPVVKYDVSVPSDQVDGFRAAAEGAVAALVPDARTWWFGHVCDDNLHLNLTGVDAPTGSPEAAALDDAVFTAVREHGGSISAEHGIGRAKVAHLDVTRSAVEIAQMRAIKAALDPDGILNPGVLLA